MTTDGEDNNPYQNSVDESLLPAKVFANSSYWDSNDVKVYKKRWYILLVSCINSLMQAGMWSTWGPIQATARAVYEWDDYVIDLITAWGTITFCITMVPLAWIMDVKGLRVSMLIAAGAQLVGSVLRFIPTGNSMGSTVLIYCGQIFVGVGGPIGMAAPPLLSSTWFPPYQRTTATAILTVTGYMGFAGSFLIGPAFVDDVKELNLPKDGDNYRLNSTQRHEYQKQINTLLYFEASLQLLVFIFIVVYYPAKPLKPPSPSAATGRIDFKEGIKQLYKNYNFLLLAVIYGASTGVYGGWCAVLYQNLSNYSVPIDAKDAGWLGFIAIACGAFSGVLFSLFADHFSGHLKLFLIGFMGLSFCCTLLICYIFTGVITFNAILVYIFFGLSGFFINGTIPFFFELGVEITYPVAEGITSGVTTFFNNFMGAIFLIVPLSTLGTKWMLWATVSTCAVSTICLVFVKEKYNRSSFDNRTKRSSSFSPEYVNS